MASYLVKSSVSNITIGTGDYDRMYIYSGGIANRTTVYSSGTMYINSGGVADRTSVYGGDMYISSGGVANSTIVYSWGSISISSGGIANSTTVYSSGTMYISSGGTANMIKENGGYVYVADGANVTFASNTISGLYLCGAMTVHSNTVANRTTIDYNGSMNIYGGVANSTNVYSGDMYISSGGIANSTTVNSYGYMYISSGGVANRTSIYSNGSMNIYGGVANNTTVYGGDMYISSGGTASSTIIYSNGSMNIYGGVANNTTVYSGDMYISSGGIANSTTVNSNSYMYISSGGTAKNIEAEVGARLGITVASNTYIQGIYDGSAFEMKNAQISGFTINDRGAMNIFSGGVANSTTISRGSMYIYSGGTANSTTVYGGDMYISSGGIANSTTVNSNGYMYISSGGTAKMIKENGGYVDVADGANVTFASNTISVYLYSYRAMTVHSNTVANSTIVYGSMYIYSGGVANSTSVQERGSMYIYSGGTANSTTVNPYGFMSISSGGVANSTTIFRGSMYIYSGGVANSTTVKSYGSMYIYSGGTANSTTVNSSSYMFISSGGVANSTTVNDWGSMFISSGGVANSTTVNYCGKMYISSGGVANSTTISRGGMSISSGGIHRGSLITDDQVSASEGAVIDFTVFDRTASDGYLINNLTLIKGAPTYTITVSADQADGTYKLAQGANDFTGTISIGDERINYGTITVNGEDFIYGAKTFSLDQADGNLTLSVKNEMIVSNGGSFSNIFVSNGTSIGVTSGGTITSTTVSSGGSIAVTNSGIASNTVVSAGGNVVVSGGSAIDTTVSSGGSMSVTSGGSADNIFIEGTVTVSNGGIANSTTVNSDGRIYISSGGTANSTTVNSGGNMHIVSGGTANMIKENGGCVYVEDGANVLFTPNVLSGFVLENGNATLHSGTVADDITVSQGTLFIYDSGKLTGTVQLSDGAAITAYSGSIIDFNVSDRSADDSYLINNLSLITGTPTYTITVSADQADGTYKLAQGAEDFAGSITIGDGSTNYGTLAVNDNALVYNNTSYTLNEIDGDLTLTIAPSDVIPPELNISGVPENWTNEDITLYVSANESCLIEYQIGDGIWTEYSDSGILITANTSINFRATDAAGNVTEKSVVVDKIDKVAPTLEISGNATDWTNQDVILNANVSDGTVEYFNGTEWVAGNSLTVTENGTYQFRVTDAAGNITEKSVVVDKIDKVAPTLEISGNATEWTNQDVILNANVSDGTVEYFNGSEWIEGNKLTVGENGTYQFRVTDAAGNITEKSVVVDKIDKVAPTLDISGNATDWTNQDVILNANVSDGIVEYFNGSDWVTGNSLTVTENGTYQFKVTDAAGNITEKSVVVDKIDKVAPTLDISGNTTEWTNKDVILNANVSDGIVEYFNGSDWVTGNSLTVTENGTYQFRVTDAAGNFTEKSVVVDKIDKVAPTLDISGNATEWTNQNVILNASVSDGTVEYFNGSEWVAGNSLTVTENGTYQFRVTDAAGNVTEKSVVVDKIDKVAPTLEISGNATNWTNQDVVLIAAVSDGTVEYFNGTEWVAGDKLTVDENGTYQFRVTDAAGNITEKSIVVDKIDKVAPTLDISGNATEWTNQDVILSASVSDGTVEYFNGSDWVAGDKLTITENGTYQFRVTDAAGNVTEKSVVVDKIDKVAPTLDISGNATEWTNQDVILNANVSDGTVEYFNGSDWVAGDKLTVTENGTYQFRVTDAAGNVTEKTVVVDKIDKVAPTLEISGNATEWTNQDVILNASVSDGTVEYFNGTEWVAGDKLTVGENGTYQFRVTDAAGNVTEKSVVVDKIDKVAPTLEISGNATEWTNQDVVLIAAVSDGTVEYFNGSDWVTGDNLTVTENGTYQFRVTDAAGNVTEKSVVVDKIDKVAPSLEISGNATEWTNQDVILNANVSDGLVEYFNGSDWVAGNSLTVTENGTYQFRVTDAAGNITEKSVVVDKIDKVAPTLEISGNATEWTNQDVILNANVSDGLVEYFNGSEWIEGNKLTVGENGTYQFRVTDAADNVTEKSVVVDKIDKVAPTLEISGNATEWTNQDVVLIAAVSDGTVEYFNGSEWIEGNKLTVGENGTYQFRVTDEAGNVTEKSVVVDKIDKVAPTIDIHLSSNNWTHNAVTANTMFKDNLSGVSNVEYSFNAQDWIVGTSATVQNNGTIYWKVTDFAGNVSYTSSVVSNIVAIDPETESPVHVYSGGLLIKDGVSFDNEHITSDHLMYVTSGGIANNTTVDGGSLAVHEGAKVTGVTFRNGGTMNYYGGTAYNVELGYGGIMTIESGAVRSGQIVDKGKMFVSNGGTASGAIIKNGGVQHVLFGGSADDTQIWLNGIVQVSSGAVVTDMLTKHGAKVHVFGGTISNTTMERGITSVYQGGKAVETEVGYGAYLMLGFTSDGCSGVASSYDTTVLSGGGLTVMSGAVAEDNVIYGTLNCNNGGILLGETTIHSRANLAGNAVVTKETSITFDVSERSASAMKESYREAMLNSYYVAREADMTISVSADQAEGSYILANWALEAKKGTFTLEVDGTEVGTFSTTKSLTYDGKTYSLYCFDDATNSKALTLKVCDAVAMDNWTELGSGDFDGDGIEESLVSDGTNLYAASEDLWLGNLSGTEEIASIADYNNDGTDDLLIHNTATDQMTAWLVKDGTTYSTLAIA